jgi:hypothetical protein
MRLRRREAMWLAPWPAGGGGKPAVLLAVWDNAYFTGCCTGRPCSPAGPEVARGFRATRAIAMTTAVTAAGTTSA